MNYSNLAFTDGIKAIQDNMGSREIYARVEKSSYTDGLSDTEIGYIGKMDSFYMASLGENGYPYIQHRGGPKGFIKVIDRETIGIVDFSGNRQYISVGNISHDPKVSLIMISYPLRARLKLYAEAEIVEISANPELYDLIKPEEYKFRPERMMLFHIKAYEWNCPQHITPRYTEEEIIELTGPYIRELEQQVESLKQQLDKQAAK